MIPLLGKTLNNRYRVEEHIGRGGMAEVYRAYDTQRGVDVALKILREDLAEDKVFLRRFEREARILAELQHPNIVRFYGFERSDGYVYILMDFIHGKTLRKIISEREQPFAEKEVLGILDPVCRALHFAHQAGRVHCDVKSSNIMVQEDGQVFLMDFGIARGMDAATSTMVGIGTPAYMAPELVRGEDPTPQTDIYALGIVLYEMLTGGERPFTGERATITGTTAEKVRWEHLNMNPTPVAQFNQGTADSFEMIIKGCLEKKAHDRYVSVLDLIDSITVLSVKDSSDLNDQEQTRGKYSDVELNREEKDTVEQREEKKKKRDRTSWIVGFLMICIGIFVLMGNSRDSSQKREITEIKPTNVQSISDLKQATLPTSTFQNQTYKNDFNGTENWECVYKVQNGDTLGELFNLFQLNFSLEQDSFYYYEHCEFNGSNFACSEQRQLVDPNQLYSEVWLIIYSHEEGKTEWESESCLSGGGFIHSVTNYEIGSTKISPVDGMTMMYVPEGQFVRESNVVYLNSYWIDQTEVTNEQYKKCVSSGYCSEPITYDSNTRQGYYKNTVYDNYPVVAVDWYQANDYCIWAGKTLPTQDEWLKAARGTDGRIYPWGNEEPNRELKNIELYDTCEVGIYPLGASPYGVLDMGGNVSEWTLDTCEWYADRLNEVGECKVVMGEFWRNSPFIYEEEFAWRSLLSYGFRCVLHDK